MRFFLSTILIFLFSKGFACTPSPSIPVTDANQKITQLLQEQEFVFHGELVSKLDFKPDAESLTYLDYYELATFRIIEPFKGVDTPYFSTVTKKNFYCDCNGSLSRTLQEGISYIIFSSQVDNPVELNENGLRPAPHPYANEAPPEIICDPWANLSITSGDNEDLSNTEIFDILRTLTP